MRILKHGKFRPMSLLVPGLFLLVLGAGNYLVGFYKGLQYQEVSRELAAVSPPIESSSPLLMMQLDPKERSFQRKKKIESRLEFYGLVEFGGLVFLLISAVLIFSGVVLKVLEQR